jgi:uncharacterized membrane protein YeaQ/YmgE (transglycosylase-associated protein family)
MITYLILLALTGLIVGALARLALPGKDPMTIPQTMGIGIAGSLIAGLVVYAITDGNRGPGFVVSVAVTTLLVYLVRRHRGGTLTDPGPGVRGRGATRRF